MDDFLSPGENTYNKDGRFVMTTRKLENSTFH
jgi:hypothetical protein